MDVYQEKHQTAKANEDTHFVEIAAINAVKVTDISISFGLESSADTGCDHIYVCSYRNRLLIFICLFKDCC